MADVIINRRHQERGRQGQWRAKACERGVARGSPAPAFPLTVRDFLTVSPSELMRRFTEGMGRFFEGTTISPITVWSPSIAIFETDEYIKVCAELPGLSEDNVKVELTQDGLSISGERTREPDEWPEGMYWSERLCRSFMRTIPIPDEAQVEKVTATFENEILMVVVPVSRSRQSPGLSASVQALLGKWFRRSTNDH